MSESDGEPAPPTHLGRLWDEAVLYVTQVHGDQVRKGGNDPYLSHLLSVAALVLEDGGNEIDSVAALLHDAVEDQGGQRRLDDIRHRFGDRVAQVVVGCSEWIQQPGQADSEKPDWCQRKSDYLTHLSVEHDASILRVALADKVHNARSMVADLRTLGPAMAGRFNASPSDLLWYYRGLVDGFAQNGSPRLHKELAQNVDEMDRLFGPLLRRAPVLGVDGAPGGWVVVRLDDGCSAQVAVHKSFAQVLTSADGAEVVAVDIPIGLSPVPRNAADLAAKKALGRNASRVFLTPSRELLSMGSYQEVRDSVAAAGLAGVSAQSYALANKIFEVDAVAADGRIFEVHPEVSFRAMNGDANLVHAKKTPNGFAERMALLRNNGVWISKDGVATKGADLDDVLDAGAAAWSARRIANGVASSLPTQPADGEHGRPIAIWY